MCKKILKKLCTCCKIQILYFVQACISVFDRRKRYSFVNFMHEDKNWYESFLFNICLPDPENWRLSQFNPHLEYYSVFGDRKKIERSKVPYKVFWTGEDTRYNFPEYHDNCVNDCTISLGFDFDDSPNYLRYPLWLLYYFGFSLDKDRIAAQVAAFNKHNSAFDDKKNKFCAMIARHDRNGIRKQMIDMLSAVDTVSCPGAAYHNDNELIKNYHDQKVEYLKTFKFNICPENISTKGYVTEKLFQAFDAGCIPIYWGADMPESEVINPKSYIVYDGISDISRIVKQLYTDPQAYSEFKKENPLLDSAVDYIYTTNKKLKELFNWYIPT